MVTRLICRMRQCKRCCSRLRLCRRRGACRDLAAEVAMADVFISHAAADSPLAEFLHRHLTQEGLSVYLASVSMPPGERWMPHIMDNLRGSTWVLCLASRAACASPWGMQEMGAAGIGN